MILYWSSSVWPHQELSVNCFLLNEIRAQARSRKKQDLGEKLLPKAVEYLHQNSESEAYQLSLKSRHGTAHICLEKASIQIQSAAMVQSEATRHAQNKSAALQRDMERWKQVSTDLLKLWVVRGSDKLQGSLMATHNLA